MGKLKIQMMKTKSTRTPKKKTTTELEKEREINREKLITQRAPIYLVVDNVRSLDNVGLLFRLCELARVKKLYLCGITGYPKGWPSDKRQIWKIERADQRIRKTAIYAVPFVPWEHRQQALSVVKKLKAGGVQIIVLEQTYGSFDYSAIHYSLPVALVVGHEIKGVSQKIIDEADFVAEIPTFGIGNSLNVALATGIVLYKVIEKTRVFDRIEGK